MSKSAMAAEGLVPKRRLVKKGDPSRYLAPSSALLVTLKKEPVEKEASNTAPAAAAAAQADVILPCQDAVRWWQEAGARWQELAEELQTKHGCIHVDPASRKRTAEGELIGGGDTREVRQRRPPATPQHGGGERLSIGGSVAQPSGKSPWEAGLSSAARLASPGPNAISWNVRRVTCAICCNEKASNQAVQLGCKHGWYCSECMERHAQARLEVGDPHITCPECLQSLPEKDLRRILPDELVEKVLARSLERAVDATSDLWACPTANCPMRVALEEGASPLLNCTMCKKSSCLRCGAQPYHKGMSCAAYASKRQQRNGEANGKHSKMKDDDESLLQWIKSCGAKQCPTCRMAVTKQDLDHQNTQYKECHKMLCRNCNTRFCFKCLSVLTATYTCGCSIDAHGFVDPRTGKRVEHLKANKVGRPKRGSK
mmetsp:Transcript_38859/g.91462  ORF Transcript_38859/g.91462 Transcript_38859/m.91462 type:complete len:428 (+) Transcript_38859:122-1405(+)